MGWQSITTIYYLSLQLIILSLTVQGSPLPNYQTYFERFDPISSSASSSSSSSSSAPSYPSIDLSSSSLISSSDVSNHHQQNHQILPETRPGNMIEFEDSYPFPVKRGGGTRNGSAADSSSSSSTSTSSSSASPPPPSPNPSLSSMMFHRHLTPIHFLIGRLIKPPETLEGPYQRGRRYRDKSDKSFIRFGRDPNPDRTLTLWPRENRKRPEKNNDTYFLRFGRSTQ